MFFSLVLLSETGSYEQVSRVFQTLRAAKAAARRFAGYAGTASVAVYRGQPGGLKVATLTGR